MFITIEKLLTLIVVNIVSFDSGVQYYMARCMFVIEGVLCNLKDIYHFEGYVPIRKRKVSQIFSFGVFGIFDRNEINLSNVYLTL